MATSDIQCPKCSSYRLIKSGIVQNRQRYKCKACSYFFTVDKMGKQIDAYYITKALQLYIEGLSLREIERLLGVSHVTVSNWIKKLNIKRPESSQYHPTYKVFTHEELTAWLANRDNVKGSGTIITELGDKFMLIKWERFRK
ncbi:MAG: hypothetical protein RLZZ367_2294 [Bacteroidota bacterium]